MNAGAKAVLVFLSTCVWIVATMVSLLDALLNHNLLSGIFGLLVGFVPICVAIYAAANEGEDEV